MTPKMWFFALCGIVVFAVLQAAVPIDVCLVEAGLPTISRWHLLMGYAHPRWFPLVVVTAALFPIGAFIGHYWSPANEPFWQTAELWLPCLLAAGLVLFAGVVFGRLVVPQTL